MMKIHWIRLSGLAGILGGLVLFAGDMLFYYDGNSADLILNMAQTSDFRIKLSGLTALFSSWFYLLGLLSIYYAFKPSSKTTRALVVMSFGGILSAYGVIHGAYVAIAATAKLGHQFQSSLDQAVRLATDANMLLRYFVYPVFAVFAFVFIKQVWQGLTRYPRWILFFFPLLPFLLKNLIFGMLSGTARVVIMGGFLNLILVVFFTASTLALWQADQPESLASK